MILFVCSQAKLRSRTAEMLCLFGGKYARSAGTDADAETILTDDLIRKASLVVCAERKHQEKLREFPSYELCTSVVLGIPDDFDRLEPALIRTLIYQMSFHDESVAKAMERGMNLLTQQQGYREALGTNSTPVGW